MNKKDYEACAVLFRAHYPPLRPQSQGGETVVRTVDSLVDGFCAIAARDNTGFDVVRFIDAATPRWHKAARCL